MNDKPVKLAVMVAAEIRASAKSKAAIGQQTLAQFITHAVTSTKPKRKGEKK